MFRKRALLLISIVVSLLIAGPIIINVLFKWSSGVKFIEAEWTAGDALSFFGSILGAFIGIVGIYFSIEKAQSNYRDDLRNQVLPFFSLNFLDKHVIPIFNKILFEHKMTAEELPKELESEKEVPQYKESRLRRLYFIIGKNVIDVKTELTAQQSGLVKTNGNTITYSGSGEIVFGKELILSQPLELENVGKGTAINVRIGFNKKETGIAARKYIKPVNLKLNESFYVNIFCENLSEDTVGEYILEIRYSDIYNNKYYQEYPVSIAHKTKDGIEGYEMSFTFETIQKKDNRKI